VNRAARALAIVPVLLGLGVASAYAVKASASDAIVYRAGKEMGTWAASGVRPGDETWQWVHDDLERARRDVPADPSVHELLGILSGGRRDRVEYQAQAVVHFATAIELRPTSPYSWINYAESKYRLGQTDQPFELALVRASQLGPFEPDVQRLVAFYGLAVFDEVASGTRKAIERMVVAGMKRNPLEMLHIAERRGRLAVACRHMAGLPRSTDSTSYKLCQSTEATS
jgi:hypothetical protein